MKLLNKSAVILSLLSFPLLGSCASAHWGYEGEHGPEHWGHQYETCGTGTKQSPIDITAPFDAAKNLLTFDYKPTSLNVVNNGHTIKASVDPGTSTLKVGDKTYNLIQFHFHSPSEHQINGKPADMVAHLVHQSEDGSLAVVGVLLNKGKQNDVIEAIWKVLPRHKGETVSSPEKINPADLLPSNRSYYNYSGSLTTPPCSEGVNWFVMKNPSNLSGESVDAFVKIFPHSVRPIQPRNDRKIFMTR